MVNYKNKIPAESVKLEGTRKLNLLTSIMEKFGIKNRNGKFKPKEICALDASKKCQRKPVSKITKVMEENSNDKNTEKLSKCCEHTQRNGVVEFVGKLE